MATGRTQVLQKIDNIQAIGRARPGRRVDEPGDWGPADPAAAAKIMPPPLENLRARGLISLEQYKAAY